ncbi:MAG TPA: Xaa-Pro peptidase family protein [Actinomycetota bacterium]|nr:Xaa-Pro peptidase family protein [Actinomycetota bacterium]
MKALQRAMEARGCDLVVVGPTANMRYLTGYRAMAVERITVLLVTGDAVAMVIPDFDADEFRHATGLDAVFEWADKHGPSEAIDGAFASLGLPGKTGPALVDDELRFDFFTHLRGHLRDEPGRASELLGPLRLSKTAAEQECMRRAGELVSHGIDVALERARPGMTELELKRAIEDALWDEGAESVDFVLVQAGANSAVGHHNADETLLREGEPVLVDIAARVDGYFGDITQQAFLGTPPEEYVRIYEIVASAQEQGVRAARAGATAADVDRAAAAVIEAAGFGDSTGPRTGHGIGLDVHEPPSVVAGDDTELVPGAAITVEPGVYLPGRFGIRIEDTVIVTGGDAQRVTRGARPLFAKQGFRATTRGD